MSKRKISLDQFVSTVLTYKDSKRKNPLTTDNGCAYTDPKTGKHCFIGQVLADLGRTVPQPDNEVDVVTLIENHPSWFFKADIDAITDLASALQEQADSNVEWRKCITGVRRRAAEEVEREGVTS
jgi:hypothetical protein